MRYENTAEKTFLANSPYGRIAMEFHEHHFYFLHKWFAFFLAPLRTFLSNICSELFPHLDCSHAFCRTSTERDHSLLFTRKVVAWVASRPHSTFTEEPTCIQMANGLLECLFVWKWKGLAAAGAFWGKYTWRRNYMTFWGKAWLYIYEDYSFSRTQHSVSRKSCASFSYSPESWSRFLAIISGHLFSSTRSH